MSGYQQGGHFVWALWFAAHRSLETVSEVTRTPVIQALTAAAPSGVKVLAVDTACQVPMQTIKCSTSKAYIFRSATEKPRKERMDSMPYSDSGQIAQIAPYASQSGVEGEAAAGAEDHPDAQGGHSWGYFVGGVEGPGTSWRMAQTHSGWS